MSQQMDSLAVSSLLYRVDRLQLPLFPEGHPRGVWGRRLHSASRGLPGGGLALQQGRCSERHAVQQRLGSDAEQFNKRQRSKKVVTWKDKKGPGACAGQTELNWTEALWHANHNPLIPAPKVQKDGLNQGCGDGSQPTGVRLLKPRWREILFQVNTRHRVGCWEVKRAKTAPGAWRKDPDLSLGLLTKARSKYQRLWYLAAGLPLSELLTLDKLWCHWSGICLMITQPDHFCADLKKKRKKKRHKI